MDRLLKAVNKYSRRRFNHQTPKPYLDRFIPRRRESNLELGNQQLLSNYGRDETTSVHVVRHGVTGGGWRGQCRSLKEECQQEQGSETNILVFSSKPQKSPGTPISNKKKPSIKRYLPNSADSIFDLPDLIDDPYRSLLDWSSKDDVTVGLSNKVYSSNMLTQHKSSTTVATGSVTCLQWDPKGETLSIGTDLGQILIWNGVTDMPALRIQTRPKCDRVVTLQWNSDSSLIYGLHNSGILTKLELSTKTFTCQRLPLKHEPVSCQLHPDTKRLAVSTRGGEILVWNVEEDKPQRSMDAHNAPIKTLAWIPWRVHMLVTACRGTEGCIRLWNVNSGELLYSVQTNSQICSLVINEVYRELITGHANGELMYWHLPNLQSVARKAAHDGRVLELAVSPDRTTLASLGAEESLKLWKCFFSAISYPTSPTKRGPTITQWMTTLLPSSTGSAPFFSTLR